MLAAQVEGAGVPVVLLHAFPLSRAMWSAQVWPLARRCRLILPDLPGFGASARLPEPSIAGMAESVVRLLDELKVREPVVLGGLSMGGYVVFEMLRQAPDRIRALALLSTRAGADSPEQREKRLKAVELIRGQGLGALADATLPKLLGAGTLAGQPAVREAVRQLILQNDPEGVADALIAMAGRRDAGDLLSAIRCPALVVAGAEDELIPPEEARRMHAAIPGATFEVIPQAGHLVNLEQPAACTALLERFVASQSSAS